MCNIYAYYIFSSTHISSYEDTFVFHKDTKCVQGHAILMAAPNIFYILHCDTNGRNKHLPGIDKIYLKSECHVITFMTNAPDSGYAPALLILRCIINRKLIINHKVNKK